MEERGVLLCERSSCVPCYVDHPMAEVGEGLTSDRESVIPQMFNVHKSMHVSVQSMHCGRTG